MFNDFTFTNTLCDKEEVRSLYGRHHKNSLSKTTSLFSMWKLGTFCPMFSNLTVFSGVFDSVVAADCVLDPFMESSLSSNLMKPKVEKRVAVLRNKIVPGMTVIEPIRWRMHHVILAHLADSRVLAVSITIKFTFKAIVLDFSCRLSQVFVHFFVTDRMIYFNACLAGTRTCSKILSLVP